MNFELDYCDHGHRVVTQHSDDKYDYSWSEDHSYEYSGAHIVTKGHDVSLFPGETIVEPGDDIHVVYVSYGSGDSFGHESGRRTHLWAFSDRKRAYRLAEALCEDAAAEPDYDYNHTPLMFEGVPINTNEWNGYFESFNDADVVSLVVKRGA